MALSALDFLVFGLFTLAVIAIALWASRHEKDEEDYFLAGRKLTWWLIGFSLIASNISTEHFVGMAGRGYELGLAIASYEWMAAITLVIVAIFFLPRFLKAGIYTIPEYLEYRYSREARTLMATYMMIIYVVVSLASVLYSGSIAIQAIFGLGMLQAVWIVAILAGIYSVWGGLAAVVWSDLFYAIALLVGGLIVTVLGFLAIGGWEPFVSASAGRLHTVLPWNHPEMPWVAVFVGGLWIPNLFYWGLNQFITQRTLGAKSLAEGQKGIILAAFIKLLIPFIIVFPGIMAAQLYPAQIANADAAYPVLMRELLPAGMRGFMFAALLGAVVSTLDSVLNSAATIFTMDLYKPYLKPEATPKHLVKVGRLSTLVLMIVGALWAPIVAGFEGVYTYIQMIQGFISPGIVAVFLFGLLWKRVPAGAAIGAMLLGIPVYGALLWRLPAVAFLHHMMITFFVLALFIFVYTMLRPLAESRQLPVRADAILETTPGVRLWGSLVIVTTLALYVVFW
ncbi:MAG: solute:sodium symporter family transporter [Longimicrobiales bacterium]